MSPPTILRVAKLGTYLSYGIRKWAEVAFVLSQFQRLTDGQTDGSLMAIPRVHSCSAVIMGNTINVTKCYRSKTETIAE